MEDLSDLILKKEMKELKLEKLIRTLPGRCIRKMLATEDNEIIKAMFDAELERSGQLHI